MPRAIIVGSGVAGPAIAQFLHRVGWQTEIYEARTQPDRYQGLFLNVGTNGLAVLESLGLRDRLLTDGHRASRMLMWSGTGKELGAVPNGPAGQPERGSVIVRREWLQQVVREGAEAAGIPIEYGSRLESISQHPGRAVATFTDGRVVEGDILIGCDGIGSPTRSHIDPAAPAPIYSGLVGLGGFAHVPGLTATPDTQHFVFGSRSFFGYLVRTDGTVYWFANVTEPNPPTGSKTQGADTDWLARLTDLHAADPFPVPQILAGNEHPLRGYPIYDLPHVPHWSRRNVVAVGDAVHAVSPSAGQGASLALEDAAVLARLLRDEPTYPAAFATYQRERQPRAEKIVKYARAIDSRKRVTKSRIGIAIRDAMMPMFLRKAANNHRNDWLYNYRAGWEQQADNTVG
ncbi:MAG: NAD(P)/FAD-dependent oxidoreductase [Nakamurella sp.]